MTARYIAAIDQGTTSSRCMIFDAAGATAQADTILRGSRTHLYGLLLKVRAAELSGEAAGARRALRAFAAAYQTERAKSLPEYDMHNQLLLDTKTQAERDTVR